MAGPWEKYQTQQAPQDGPWMRYQPKADDMQSRIAAAKAGTLEVPQERLDAAAAADQAAMEQMTLQQGLIGRAGELAAGFTAGMARGVGDIGGGGRATIEADIDPATGQVQAGPIQPLDGRAVMSDITGGFSDFEASGRAGGYAGTIGEFLPWVATQGPGAMLKYGVAPAIASEAAGQATEGTDAEPWARFAAAILTPGALGAANKIGRSLISPNSGTNPQRLDMARRLETEGVPVSAGQKTGSSNLQYEESVSPRMADLWEKQSEAFTRATMRRVGVDGVADPETLRAATRAIGSVFDDVARGTAIEAKPRTAFALSRASREYAEIAPRGNFSPIFENIATKVKDYVRTGKPIPGAQYQSWRSSLSKMTTSSDTATREAAISALDALDTALTTTLTTAGRADDVARLATARTRYRDLLAIEKAVSGAGDAAAMGLISPAQLRTAIKSQGVRSYAQGQRDLGELARAGSVVMRAPPQSGTQPRLMAEMTRRLGPIAGGGGVGAGAGAMIGGVPGAMIGGGIGALAPRAYNALRTSPVGQAYLANQAVSPGGNVLNRNFAATIGAAMQNR